MFFDLKVVFIFGPKIIHANRLIFLSTEYDALSVVNFDSLELTARSDYLVSNLQLFLRKER